MKNKSTPGPWVYQKTIPTPIVYSPNHPEGKVCFFHPDDKMADINGPLIAAIPALIKACEKALDTLCATDYEVKDNKTITRKDFFEQAMDTIATLKTALANARGEEGER